MVAPKHFPNLHPLLCAGHCWPQLCLLPLLPCGAQAGALDHSYAGACAQAAATPGGAATGSPANLACSCTHCPYH